MSSLVKELKREIKLKIYIEKTKIQLLKCLTIQLKKNVNYLFTDVIIKDIFK
jgi:hypothetical protein